MKVIGLVVWGSGRSVRVEGLGEAIQKWEGLFNCEVLEIETLRS